MASREMFSFVERLLNDDTQVIRRTVACLYESGALWAARGAFAASAWSTPRFTCQVGVSLDPANSSDTIRCLVGSGLGIDAVGDRVYVRADGSSACVELHVESIVGKPRQREVYGLSIAAPFPTVVVRQLAAEATTGKALDRQLAWVCLLTLIEERPYLENYLPVGSRGEYARRVAPVVGATA